MTDREILYKAYEKAYKDNFATDVFEHDVIDYHGDGSLSEDQYLRDIFSHDFAKQFWGEERIFYKLLEQTEHDKQVGLEGSEKSLHIETYGGRLEYYQLPAWKIHLQQMVLETNRLKYLEKFL